MRNYLQDNRNYNMGNNVKSDFSNQHIAYYDILRIMATFAVVILHTAATYWYGIDVHSYTWKSFNFWDAIVRWSVPEFVMISGALFLSKRGGNNSKKIYTKNIFRVVTAYLFWSFIYAAREKRGNPSISWYGFFELIVQGHYHMWFLWMIVGIYMSIPILQKITSNENTLKYFLMLAFAFNCVLPTVQTFSTAIKIVFPDVSAVTIIDGFYEVLQRFDLQIVLGYTGYFLLGFYIATHNIRKRCRVILYILCILSFIFTILATSYVSGRQGKGFENFFGNYDLNIMLQSTAIFVFMKYKEIHIGSKLKIIIEKISKYTFGIYLVHALVLEVLNAHFGLSTLSFNAMLSVPVIALIVFGISLGISAFIHKIPVLKEYIV